MSAEHRALVFQLCSRLLGYPDTELLEELDLLAAAAGELPAQLGEPILGVIEHLRAGPPMEVAAHYVRTLDQRRSCAPYLTYYTHGDTRRRGMALVEFVQAYREAGTTAPAGELPDHLAVVLEFAATVDPQAGLALLQAHRAGLELLVRGMARAGTPYAGLVRAVLAVLPPARPQDLAAAAELASAGPPVELVGLGGLGGLGVDGPDGVEPLAGYAVGGLPEREGMRR